MISHLMLCGYIPEILTLSWKINDHLSHTKKRVQSSLEDTPHKKEISYNPSTESGVLYSAFSHKPKGTIFRKKDLKPAFTASYIDNLRAQSIPFIAYGVDNLGKIRFVFGSQKEFLDLLESNKQTKVIKEIDPEIIGNKLQEQKLEQFIVVSMEETHKLEEDYKIKKSDFEKEYAIILEVLGKKVSNRPLIDAIMRQCITEISSELSQVREIFLRSEEVMSADALINKIISDILPKYILKIEWSLKK